MSVIPIVTGPDTPILRQKVDEVKAITKKTLALIKSMKETMLAANGVGIAGPQVGENQRIIICRFEAETPQEKIIAMINPEITWFSNNQDTAEEGCLSLPKVYGKVTRPQAIKVTFQNEKGQTQSYQYTGFNARIVQHEVDHLNGILFIDYA